MEVRWLGEILGSRSGADSGGHDSLGEGYMVRGDRKKAVASYKRSLELNPENANAVEMLGRLGE